jgi:hypothetical protein
VRELRISYTVLNLGIEGLEGIEMPKPPPKKPEADYKKPLERDPKEVTDLAELQVIAKENTKELKNLRVSADTCGDLEQKKELEQRIHAGRILQYKLVQRRNELEQEVDKKKEEEELERKREASNRLGIPQLHKRRAELMEMLTKLGSDIRMAHLSARGAEDRRQVSQLVQFDRMVSAALGALNNVRIDVYDVDEPDDNNDDES